MPPPLSDSLPPLGSSPDSSFVPPRPTFPLRWRAKLRFLVGPSAHAGAFRPGDQPSVFERAAHSMSAKPTLSLVHFDGVSKKVREDFYTLRAGIHRRFFSSIKHFRSSREWLIYHKQPKSPRACFEIPFSHTLSSLFAAPGTPQVTEAFFDRYRELGDELEYQGLATLQLLGEQPQTDGEREDREANVTVLHYKVRQVIDFDRRASSSETLIGGHPGHPLFESPMPPVHVYLHPLTHQPLVLSTPHLRIDVLSFQAVTDADQAKRLAAVFQPQRASKAKCAPFTEERLKNTQKPEYEGHDEL